VIVGTLGTEGRALVDPRGAVSVVGDDWTLDWWIGADDRWRVPAREPAVRQEAFGGVAIAETRLRVPGGDAVQRVYGVAGRGDPVVIEIENDSPAAFIVAFAVRGATSIAVEGSEVTIDGRVAMVVPFPPRRWDVTDLDLAADQCGAQTGVLPPTTLAPGTLRATLLYPLSHRNKLRVAVVAGEERPRLDLAQLPGPKDVVKGWYRHLERGMRVRGIEERIADLDLARTQVLLDPRPGAATAAALEDWGFDDEAAWAWEGLTGRERRAARSRAVADDGPAGRLLAARAAYVRDGDDAVELLVGGVDPGVDLEVFDAPTRHGTVSFALRWHGEHPALLWEVKDAARPVELRVPAIAPDWSTTDPVGETLLH
jgi:hypothetical protein